MKALLVIDMLEDFFGEGPLEAIRKELTDRINTLTSRVRIAGIPVVWVHQEFREDLEDAFLIMRNRNIKATDCDESQQPHEAGAREKGALFAGQHTSVYVSADVRQ